MSKRSPDRLNPQERSLHAKLAAHRLHATHDSRELTASARRAFLDRFEREVDPAGTLDPVERARRAAHAKSAYFAKLALQSSRARRARKDARS